MTNYCKSPRDNISEVAKVLIETSQTQTRKKEQVDRKKVRKTNQNTFTDMEGLEKFILQHIIGQDIPVKRIITSIYRSIKFDSMKSNILIVGNSGTGKTETLKQIAQKLDIPYTIEDATKYTKEGYVGEDVNDMLYNLCARAKYDIKRAEHGLLIIDEIDKKTNSSSFQDISGTDVLKSLLKIIEGTLVKMYIPDEMYNDKNLLNGDYFFFDTSNIIVVFMGAFPGLDKIRNKRLGNSDIGFKNNIQSTSNLEQAFTKKDLVQYGMLEEFVGRIDTVIEMNKLTELDLANILLKSKLSIFNKYKRELDKRGIALCYKEQLFHEIAKKSLSVDTGARELNNTVNYIFENIIYNIMSSSKVYHRCTLDLDIVNDNTKYKLS